MWEEFQNLLDYYKDKDLQCIYAPLTRIPKGLELLRKKFEDHVKRAGQAAISKLVGEGGANAKLEPRTYVDALFEVYRNGASRMRWASLLRLIRRAETLSTATLQLVTRQPNRPNCSPSTQMRY